MFDNLDLNPHTSPFGVTGTARDLSSGSTVHRSSDILGRDTITERNPFGADTKETRDFFGNVIERRSTFF